MSLGTAWRKEVILAKCPTTVWVLCSEKVVLVAVLFRVSWGSWEEATLLRLFLPPAGFQTSCHRGEGKKQIQPGCINSVPVGLFGGLLGGLPWIASTRAFVIRNAEGLRSLHRFSPRRGGISSLWKDRLCHRRRSRSGPSNGPRSRRWLVF